MSDLARRVAIIAAIGLAALVAGDAAPAHGASFTVNATHDAVDAAPGDGVCADAGGACTLRAAVEETNALPGADAISVAPGTYILTQSPGRTGSLEIIDDLEIVGAGASLTVVRTTNPDTYMIARVFHLPCWNRSLNVQISGVTISGGLDEGGGGILKCGHTLKLRSVVVSGNGGGGLYGGGVRNHGGNLIAEDSLFVDNWAQRGGAIDNESRMTLTNVTISGNESIEWGGAVYSVGEATLTNVSIIGNDNGGNLPGGIFGGGFALKNTILAANTGLGNCYGTVSSLGHNISSDNSCGLNDPGDLNGVDPQLTGLQNNGGPTLTHGLYPSSPAIDAGDPNGCPPTDQRGVARPQGAACDIGAYEYVTPPTAPPTEPPADTSPPTDAATDTPTPGPTPKPKGSPSPSPSASPSLNISSPAGRQRSQPTFAAVLVDVPRTVPGVEEDAGGGAPLLAIGLGATGVLGLAGSAASAGFFWYRRRRPRPR